MISITVCLWVVWICIKRQWSTLPVWHELAFILIRTWFELRRPERPFQKVSTYG
jgi:hypothetical protein